MGEFFRRAAGEVGDRSVVLEYSAHDLEVRDASGERIADGLEDVEGERRGGGDGSLRGFGFGRGGHAGDALALDGRGDVVEEKVEDLVAADVAQAGSEEHGEELVFAYRIVNAGDDVLLADSSGLEEFAHQLVIAFGDQLDQGLVGCLGLLGQAGGDLFDAGAPIAADLIVVGLHLDQIDDALEGLLGPDGELDGDDGASEGGGERLHHALEVRALTVHAGADDHARQLEILGVAPNLLRDHLDAGDRIDHDQRGIHDRQGELGLVHEHVEAGGVDEVDFDLVPLDRGERSGDGHLAGDLFLVVVGRGAAVIHAAQARRAAGGEEKGRDQRSFAGVGVADDGHIADVCTFVGFH